MLRETTKPLDIKLVQDLSYKAFSDVIKLLEEVNREYKKMSNNFKEQEDGLKQVYEMGYQKEVGWYLELFDSLRQINQFTESEIKQMKQTLKKAKKQKWG
jgi:hypothetical protein